MRILTLETFVKHNIDDVNIEDHKSVKKAGTKAMAGPVDRPRRTVPKPRRPKTYHHGSLRQALVQAAERILARDGLQGLTLRAAAREAGVSHAAPKNHFGDLAGLLSDLAAVGFERLGVALMANVRDGDPMPARMDVIGQGYVAFAKANPALFLLMFRSERLDFSRPALREAAGAAFGALSGAVGEHRHETLETKLTLPQAAGVAASWSLVHGFAMLLLDGRLKGLLRRLPPGVDDRALLSAIFAGAKPRR
jgi:AcrR family transcriptional regulator